MVFGHSCRASTDFVNKCFFFHNITIWIKLNFIVSNSRQKTMTEKIMLELQLQLPYLAPITSWVDVLHQFILVCKALLWFTGLQTQKQGKPPWEDRWEKERVYIREVLFSEVCAWVVPMPTVSGSVFGACSVRSWRL